MPRACIHCRFIAILTGLVLLTGCPSAPAPAQAQHWSETPANVDAWSVLAANIDGGVLMAGTVLPDGTALAVGGQSDAGAVWLWKNKQLQPEPVPPGKLLSWVSTLPDGEVLVLGNGRRALWRTPAGVWTAESLPDGDELWGCTAFSHDDAWAVGANIAADKITATPILLHRTAAGWTTVALPAIKQPSVRLFKVDGHSPSDVVVVGDDGEALHFDGKAWTEEASGTGENLTTVRTVSGGRYLAVGGRGTGVARMRGVDGVWRKVRDVESGLSGVDVWEDGAWTCGSAGWLQWIALDGSLSAIATSVTTDDLHMMLHLPDGSALAGGGNLAAWPGKMHGTLLGWTRPLP